MPTHRNLLAGVVHVVALSACGRIGFDPRSSDVGDAAPDMADDSASGFDYCAPILPVPNPVTLVGTTRHLTPFTNTTPEPNATLSVRQGLNAAVIGGGSSDASGAFSLDLSSGGSPIDFTVQVSKGGFFTTSVRIDFPLAGQMPPFEGVTVTQADIDNMYAAAGLVHDSTRGTIALEITDCAGAPLAGATIATIAPNGGIRYVDTTGAPTLTTTTTSRGLAVLFNVVVGNLDISINVPGYTFPVHSTRAASLTSFAYELARPIP